MYKGGENDKGDVASQVNPESEAQSPAPELLEAKDSPAADLVVAGNAANDAGNGQEPKEDTLQRLGRYRQQV